MNSEKAKILFDRINLTKHIKLKNELFNVAIRYARIRTDWYFMDDEEKRASDEMRSRTHNSLIDNFNILSREMLKAGEDISWRIHLGDNRKEIGDFACHIHNFLGLDSR